MSFFNLRFFRFPGEKENKSSGETDLVQRVTDHLVHFVLPGDELCQPGMRFTPSGFFPHGILLLFGSLFHSFSFPSSALRNHKGLYSSSAGNTISNLVHFCFLLHFCYGAFPPRRLILSGISVFPMPIREVTDRTNCRFWKTASLFSILPRNTRAMVFPPSRFRAWVTPRAFIISAIRCMVPLLSFRLPCTDSREIVPRFDHAQRVPGLQVPVVAAVHLFVDHPVPDQDGTEASNT